MKLLSLQVENFGRLSGLSLDFTDGLNVLHQKNGWGKSTLAVFIKAMLYGLPASQKKSLDENERKKYTPWQGGAFGGSLSFASDKGAFRIERFFGSKESADSFALYDLSTNLPSDTYSSAVGEDLFGIDADGFERSSYLSQRLLGGNRENNSIAAKLGNLLDDVGDIGNFDNAQKALEKRRSYYALKGGRGAIADLERERLDCKTELERCRRIEEALRAQEAEQSALAVQIAAQQQHLKELHAALQKAGHAREYAALLEQKARMQAELNELMQQKGEIESRFRGELPSITQLVTAQERFEEIRRNSVRLEMLTAPGPEKKELQAIDERYPQPLPDAHTLSKCEQQLRELERMEARREALTASQDADAILQRFPEGAPTDGCLEAASRSHARSRQLQKQLAALPPDGNKGKALLPLSLILFLLGAVTVGLTFLPTLSAFAPLLWIFAALSTVGGVIGLLIRGRRAAKQSILTAEKQGLARQIADEEQKLLDLLAAYRIPANRGDLRQALGELTLLTRQYREALEKRARVVEEQAALSRSLTELLSALCTLLRPYEQSCRTAADCRAVLQALRETAQRQATLQAALSARRAEAAEVRRQLEDSKKQLLPFLQSYDGGRHAAGECLTRIAEDRNLHTRLVRQIADRQTSLAAFVAEKKLDGLGDSVDKHAFEHLSTDEQTARSELERLQKQYTVLGSEINRLAQDADRIPDLTQEQARLSERLAEARANFATIASTAAFLEQAKIALNTRYLDGMQKSFCRHFEALTGADAPESLMDASFEVHLREVGKTRDPESFSRGMRDAMSFCVRLALTEALCADGEKPFLLLDDPFVNLDDDRLAAARTMLEKLADEYQILYLVCNRDRI